MWLITFCLFGLHSNLYKLVPIMGTIMQSKENKVLKLFFNQPTKEWHFEELIKETKMARSKVDRWLKKLVKEKIIVKVKKKSRWPHYRGNYASPEYRTRKKLFALQELSDSGLWKHLLSLPKAKTIFVFGSFARSDWYKESDIDLFIYGNSEGLKIAPYELKLNREIQLFSCENKTELNKFNPALMRNIIKGELIKGDLDFLEVKLSA